MRAGRTAAAVLGALLLLLLPGCAAVDEPATSAGAGTGAVGPETAPGTADPASAAPGVLDCGTRELQSSYLALEGGAGLPDPDAAVDEAQATGWLPAGRAEVLGQAGRGVVRADGTVVAAFLLEDVGDGWYVTSVETCYEG